MSEKMIQIPSHLMLPIEGYDAKKMRLFLEVYNDSKMELFLEKDRQYGGSWQTDGFLSAYFNLKRKIDRVVQRFKNGSLWTFSNDSTGESTIDTFMDLENYSAMNAAFLFLSTKDESVFKAFISKVPRLGDFFSFAKVNSSVQIITEGIEVPMTRATFNEEEIEKHLFNVAGQEGANAALKHFKDFYSARCKRVHKKLTK